MQSGLDIVCLNESDLASLLKSLDFAHFDAATQTEAQTEAEENDEPVLRRSNRKRSLPCRGF